MEKIYKSMKVSGAASIAIGVVTLVIGVAAGVLNIVVGAVLLKNKSDITF